MNNSNYALYLIISCPQAIIFEDKLIDLKRSKQVNILKKELVQIKVNNKSFLDIKEITESIKGKNIYLFNAIINLENLNESINIKIKYLNKDLISKEPIKFKKNDKNKFIYSISYDYEGYFGNLYLNNREKIENFKNKKYEIEDSKKFVIFKQYLERDKNASSIQYLLECTSNVFYNAKEIIDYEFILNFFIYLISNIEPKQNKERLERIFNSTISKFIDLKPINIKKYKNQKYNNIIKKIEIYREEFANTNFILSLDLFILVFYKVNYFNKFGEKFNIIKQKDKAVDYILKHKNIFNKFYCSDLELIYKNANNNKFNDIIKLSSNYNEYIKFFCLNIQILEDKKIIDIDLENFPEIDVNCDINDLDKFINYVINNHKKYFPTNQFEELINKLKLKDYNKLLQLKNIFSKYQKKRIMEKLDEAIHYTGKIFIEKNKLNNLEIIRFIQNDALIYYKAYETNFEYATLISHINLEEINDEFCEQFNKVHYDYQKLMKNNYSRFLNSIINKANSFNHLSILFKIFNKNKNWEKNRHLLKALIEAYEKIMRDKELKIDEVSNIIGTLFKFVSDNDNYLLHNLIEKTNEKFKKIEIAEISMNILNEMGYKLNNIITDKLLKDITNNDILSGKSIITILNQLDNINIKKQFLEKQKIKIEKGEIFKKELSKNIIFIEDLINYGFLSAEFKDVDLIKNIKSIMGNEIKNLKNLNFKFEQLSIMNELYKTEINNYRNELEHLLFIISLGEKEVLDELYSLLESKIKYCIDTYNKIEEIINIFVIYYNKEEETTIERYKVTKKEIIEKKINEFPDKNKIFQFDQMYDKANEITKLKESKFFLEIFEKNKLNKIKINSKDDSLIVNETKNQFKNLIKLFDIKTENEIDLKFLEELLEKFENDDIKKEINILLRMLVIEKKKKENIYEKLELLKKRNKNIIKLSKIILLLNDFELQDTDIKKILEKAVKDLEQNLSLQKLIEIDRNIINLNLDILSLELNSEPIIVLNKMYENHELINFIKDKTINDIHQMGEFIDDSEDVYITILDINYLESCKQFYDELKREVSSEKNFLDNFINITKKDNYKDIGMKFENSQGKYNDFQELYVNHLNLNEFNKQHIKSIYLLSSFNLIPSYPLYKCNVEYSINSKKIHKVFDEILDLREVALLRKKDQKEENYFDICEKFANNIIQIQKIIKLLNIISSKGYFEEISFEIIIKDGNSIGYKNKNKDKEYDLKEIISELKSIEESQDIIVKEIYSVNPISRMIYGKQFEYIYKNMNKDKNINYNINNLLKYITNNNYKNEVQEIINSEEENKIKQMYVNVNVYLGKLLEINSVSLENIYKNAFLLDNKKKGIYSYSCLLEDIEVNVINCFLSLTGNFPIAQTILYCNDSTTEEEITSFIYRSVKCDYNALFILIKPEILSIEKKNLLMQILKDIYSREPLEMKSCLLIVYDKLNKTKEIIIEIGKLPNHKYYNYEENNDYKSKKFLNIEVYTSEYSGLGKTDLIKKKFREENNNNDYKYDYFPIGGDIKRDEIITRLLSLSDKNILLHLDINEFYNDENKEIIKEFLFRFLFLKYYSLNEKIFFYGKEMKIKIEISNSLIDLQQLLPILKFFEIINIRQNNIPELNIEQEVKSNIQIVCNYLKRMNEINQNDIYIPGLFEDLKEPTKNYIKATSLSQGECKNLIFKNINIENPNYYQITSYVNIIAEQLRLFSGSYYLNVEHLNEIKQVKKNLDNIRYYFVHSLTLITKNFITSSYDNIIKGQEITFFQQQGKIDLEKAKEQANEVLSEKETFSIEKIRPSMILINEDGQSISIIVTCKDDLDVLKAIYNSDLPDESRGVIDYHNLSSKEYLIEVKKVLNLFNPIDDNDNTAPKSKNGKILRTLENIVESYVFTADNFIKLILISLRLRTNIPVIMMGETGCGKTSLIRIIAELKDVKMHTLNIHAGIEDEDIIEFIKEKNLFEKDNKDNDTVWVFLDEINTCNSLNLIMEIMIKNTCKGDKIRPNVKFIAACNPYRLDTKEKEIIGLYDDTKHLSRKLVYTVNPLPMPLLNFVFDFGAPSSEDIRRYISNLVLPILKKLISDNNCLNKIKKLTENAIFDSQEFIRNNLGISSVSLRDVRRWGIFFEWFCKFLKIPYFTDYNFSDEQIYIYSLNLSIYLCYYIRIFNKLLRNEFCNLMKESFENYDFEEFPKEIQKIIANEVELDKGIAKNRALLENLFSIFVCLNTKIPLFIIGKPGCSKSLSSQLIFKSMNGKDNKFFKYFPKVYTKSYQGSLTSNSKGVLSIFKKARKSLEDLKYNKEIISSIYFDEMGLSEISPNNPLKVIHSELEYDEYKKKIAFIGISNWPLDASKMNRGIHLSITEPDEEDLKETAFELAKSYNGRLIQDYKEYFEYLAFSYYKYKELLKTKYSEFDKENSKNIKEFHGTRDFYHLIKTASKLLLESNFTKEKYQIEKILMESIERNFGGLENSIKKFKEIFKEYVPNTDDISEYKVMNCITNNILDSTSRYLLIITKSSISHFLIKLILDTLKKKHTFYYGSNFEEDNLQGYYSAKILNKIQITMSNENVMILKNLTSMYPSLYDLFNQNFRKIGESNYARIALGDSNTQNYYVNNNFRCVVLLDKNEIDEQDPPFINRFEKHIITFEYLLSEEQVKMSKQIRQIFYELIHSTNQDLKIDLKYQLLNCDLEEIQGIFYKLSEDFKKEENQNKAENKINLNEINREENRIELNKDNRFIDFNLNKYKEKIFEKIIPTFSEDLIFYAKNSNFAQKYKEEFRNIMDIYFERQYQHKNLKSYLEKIDSNKHIIYTFSNILDSIFGLKNEIKSIENIKYGKFSKEKTKIIFIEQINSEREIDDKIKDFYSKKQYNLCVFHYDIYDCIHLNHVNYLIENNENTLNDEEINSKVILFIIHLKRRVLKNKNKVKKQIHSEYLISHLTKLNHFFIDNLNGKEVNFKQVINSNNFELFSNSDLINLDEEFTKDFFHAFSLISYNIEINFSNIQKEEYIEKVCEFINNNNHLKKLIKNIIMNKIKTVKNNIIMEIYSNYNFEDTDVDFISVLVKYMKSIFNEKLIYTLIELEKYNILSTKLLCSEEMKNEIVDNIYEEYIIKSIDFSTQNYASFSETIKIDCIFGISYPFIITEFKKVNNYTKTLIKKYLENDNYYRFEQFEEQEDYFNEKNLIENNLLKEIEKFYFAKFLNNELNNLNKEKLFEILLKDYIIYYLSKSNTKFTNKNIFDFFYKLYELFVSRDENENNLLYSLENFSKFILFIESYNEYIYALCDYAYSFDSYINDFLNNFISQIDKKRFKNNSHISYVNSIFFNIYESITYCILNIGEKFENLSIEELNKFLNEVSQLSNSISKANNELKLTLKQIFYLSELILVKDIFNKNGFPIKENLQFYINLLSEENEKYLIPQYSNIELDIDNNEDIIDKEFSFLKEKISKIKEYPDLIGRLLNNKIKISKNEDYRLKLLNIIFSNNLFIKNNRAIFSLLLKKYKICPINKSSKKNLKKNEIKERENEEEEEEENIEDEENEENDEDDEDGSGVLFLSQLNKDKNNNIIKFLNETDNICFDEILLSLFDGEFTTFFENKKAEEDLILNQSFEIFQKCVDYIIKEENYKNIASDKLGILYCISYIKYYCYNFSRILYDKEYENINKNEIYSFFKNNPHKFTKIIKIYIFRLLNIIKIKNYNDFLKFIIEKDIFLKDFDFEEKVPCSLDYLFIQNDNIDTYRELRNRYNLDKMENFKSTKEILEKIGNNIFIFYDLITNEEISNIFKNFKKDSYIKLTHFLSDIIKKLEIAPITKQLFLIYYNFDSLKTKILPILKNISIKNYEILLYAHKFALISSMSKNGSVYLKILSQKILDNIKDIYIPGGEPNDTLLIESAKNIKEYFENDFKLNFKNMPEKEEKIKKLGIGVYMCSCNLWYTIKNCGNPDQLVTCGLCGKQIGNIENKKELIRIYKDGDPKDERYTCKYLSELMKEAEEQKKINYKGFKKVNINFFYKPDKKVRNMSKATYRILSFIFYSCIFYCEKLDYLDDNAIKTFYFNDGDQKNNSILFILTKIWEILTDELIRRDVDNIQCFINMIFPELAKIINNNDKSMKDPNERNQFEDSCNQVIEEAISNYKNYYKIYIENNKDILKIEDITIKPILQETSDINNLPKEDFPLIKYFYATSYPNYEKFYEQLTSKPNFKNLYPVIDNYLNASQDEHTKLFLENCELINPFVNYTIDKYSNKISREDAKKIKIKDELGEDNQMQNLFNHFKKGWEKIYKEISNYDCKGKLKPKIITEDDCLAYCLNDNSENDYGKYIASAYSDIIKYQNKFLEPLIDINANNDYLYIYSNQINKKIIVQRATKKEIVSFNINNNLYKSFDNLIYSFCYRNCFKENGDVYYLKYKDIKFDLLSIEIELSKILLPGKRLFSNEEDQNFITYAFDGFNKNMNIIADYRVKIKEIKVLSNEEKTYLSNIIEKIDYKVIIFNLQSLFLYFSYKRNINGNEILIDEINLLPKKVLKLDDEFITIFKNHQFKITLSQLIDCYEYVEFLSYDKILKNVSEKINGNLRDDQIKEINKHFEENKKLLITKKDLSNATRKFISRYLVGDKYIKIDSNIFEFLKIKNELWDDKIISEKNEELFEKEINELKSINIEVKQAVDFYEKLGGERAEKRINKQNNEKKLKKNKKKKKANYDNDY